MEARKSLRRPRGGSGGVVFTPPALARSLAGHFATPAVEGGPALLDPACGDGALLLAALQARGGGPREARQLFGIEIDPDLRARALLRLAESGGLDPAELEGNVLCADALDPGTPWPPGTAIIANPPWVSFSGRQAARAPRAPWHRGPGGWPSLQGAFLLRIATHCADQGQEARLLLPGSILELERYGPLREAIAEFAHFDGPPEELGEDAFPGVLEPAVLVGLVPGPGDDAPGQHARSTLESGLLGRLEGFPKLPPETFADPGVHTGNSSALLVLEEPRGNCATLRRGADLEAFSLGQPRKHLRLDLERNTEQRFRIASLEYYRAFPVLLRQTANRPIAALHEEPTYFRNSLLAGRHVDGLQPEFLVALLNSPVATLWHRNMFRDARQRSFPQVKVGHLRTQPTPILRRADDPRLHDEIVTRVRALDAGSSAFPGECEEIGREMARAFGLPDGSLAE